MNGNGKFWEIGLKILAAAVVGIAVFVGIDKSTSRRNNPNNGPQPSPENNNQQNQSWEPAGEQKREETRPENNNKAVGEKVVNGLRGMYGTFGKLSQVISSLVDVVGSIGRLFGNDDYGYPPRQPYYNINNPWSCGCTISPGLNRVNDYIIQVGPMPGQQYGNNYNGGYC